MSPLVRCRRCGEEFGRRGGVCPACGLSNINDLDGFIDVRQFSLAVRFRVEEWRRRFGDLAVLASVGVLPLFPLTPIIGIGAGAIAIARMHRGAAPRAGYGLAVAGIIGGIAWSAAALAGIRNIFECLAALRAASPLLLQRAEQLTQSI